MKYLVLGGGVSGIAAARLLRRHGQEVALFDKRAEALVDLRDDAYEIHAGDWHAGYLRGITAVVASPGFGEHSTPIVDGAAAGVEVMSELELGWRYSASPIIAVTGTNGKTTTTQLITDMAAAGGLSVVAAGNIGTALSDVAEQDHDLIVAEASSFQLKFISTFAPKVAVVLNVAPDHLDWHGSFEAYAAAKARITENMAAEDALVFDADDAGAVAIAGSAAVRTLGVSGKRREDAGGVEDGTLWVGSEAIEVGPFDAAFALDIAAAAVAVRQVGVGTEAMAKAVAEFEPAPHRRTIVATAGGVTWVDDSKATNPHAAMASAASFDSVILIAGGRNKGLDLSGLAAVPSVRHIFAIGEAAPELLAAAPHKATAAASIEAAVIAAGDMAQPGDAVLLAPGCASFDQFESYAARGDAFTAAVKARSN
ncbi:MAG: UDP-N-acetylmuramoyl-L-alanine--D-glutamate ligase [Acidimicrobiia bacterium]|nr:UDP-N-acetylmuramoyl-L-alanine--D-glutamate ligase [Acidimicrobiia bacterium]